MFILYFVAAFVAVSLAGWALYALTRPVQAGQGILIFLCKAAGVIALLAGGGFWIGQGFIYAVPGFLLMMCFFAAANQLELRWRRRW